MFFSNPLCVSTNKSKKGAKQDWRAHKSNVGNIHSGTATSMGESKAGFGFGDETVNALGVATNLKLGKVTLLTPHSLMLIYPSVCLP